MNDDGGLLSAVIIHHCFIIPLRGYCDMHVTSLMLGQCGQNENPLKGIKNE